MCILSFKNKSHSVLVHEHLHLTGKRKSGSGWHSVIKEGDDHEFIRIRRLKKQRTDLFVCIKPLFKKELCG